MRKKLPRTEQMIDAAQTMYWFNKGKMGSLKEQVHQLENILGVSIPEWAGKTQEEINEEWSVNRLRRFYQLEWRIRWDNKSERMIFHDGTAWIHKKIHAKYLQTLGAQGVDEAKKLLGRVVKAMEPNLQANMTQINAYLTALGQMESESFQQLTLFANPEAEEHVQ